MKNAMILLWLIAGFCLLMACEKEVEEPVLFPEDEMTRGELPFRADFLGNYVCTEPCSVCGDEPWIMITNEGGGTGTFLGNFTHHFEFCCDMVSSKYPGNYMKAYFVASCGDTLFVACEGRVIEGRAEDHPDYVTSYFRDPFEILGGTGRFSGATGRGNTDDYNSSLDANSHHHWRGIITLTRGKW